MFIRGTTPTIQFDLPIDSSMVKVLYITVHQCGKLILEKTLADCSCEGKKVKYKFTQEETISFTSEYTVSIQVRGKTTGGDAFASGIFSVKPEMILKEGVI